MTEPNYGIHGQGAFQPFKQRPDSACVSLRTSYHLLSYECINGRIIRNRNAFSDIYMRKTVLLFSEKEPARIIIII